MARLAMIRITLRKCVVYQLTASNKVTLKFSGHKDQATSATITPDGKYLFSASQDGKELKTFYGHSKMVKFTRKYETKIKNIKNPDIFHGQFSLF